jgi:HK97 family phage major capsid protein
MNERLRQLKAQIEATDKKISEGETAVAEHRKAIEDVPLEDLKAGNEQFDKIEELLKPVSTARHEKAQLEHQFQTLALMEPDGGKSLKEDPEERELKTKAKDFAHSESLGDKVIASETYKALKESGAFDGGSQQGIGGQKALTDAEPRDEAFKALRARAAQAKALITGQTSNAGGSLLVPEQIAGIDVAPQLPLGLFGLVTIGSTSARSVQYRRLLSRTIRAAAVKEAASSGDIDGSTVTALQGGLKPESDLLFEAAVAAVSTFAHLIPMTRDELDDAEGLASVINTEMRSGVEREAERQIAKGTGTNDQLLGIYNTPGIAAYTQGTTDADEPRVDAIHRVITLLALAGYYPSAVGMHPTDWQEIRLSKDANGNYIYGPPSQVGPVQVWGVPVVQTIAIDAGAPIVAEWTRAEYRVRSGVQTFLSDSHKDWFARNLLALLAEMRGMLLIRRPQAFGKVTFV